MVKSNTRKSSPISSARGNVSGRSFNPACVPHTARSNPSAPAAMASSRLSVSSCQTILRRLAPSAVRTANSLIRLAERASMRLATLTQAINSTNPTAAINTSRNSRTSPTICSFNGTSFAVVPLFTSGKATAKFRLTCAISALAWSRLTPGLSLRWIPRIPSPAARSVSEGFLHCPMGT